MNHLKITICTITLSMLTSLSIAYAQDAPKLSNEANEVLKMINAPQNKNDMLNDLQNQNNNELVMSIMKSVEDKNIKDINSKIQFVNSFSVSNDIKDQAISLIKQNIAYSDNEKVSYGVYMLKKCDEIHKVNDCVVDYKPTPSCVYERSNICC